jgi:hypothetical protein
MKKLGATLLCAAIILTCAAASGQSHAPAKAKDPGAAAAPTAKRQKLAAPASYDQAAAWVSNMSIRSDQVRKLLMKARGNQQLTQVRCLDGLLSQAHAVERLGRRTQRSIELALARGLRQRAEAHGARLAVYESRSQGLLEEANHCVTPVSRRVRVPSGYTVRVIPPRLPPSPEVSRRFGADASVWPRPTTASNR